MSGSASMTVRTLTTIRSRITRCRRGRRLMRMRAGIRARVDTQVRFQFLRKVSTMASASVTLNGRFSPGSVVELVQVKDETVMRSEGGKVIGSQTVDKDGQVGFTTGVTAGGRYFIRGQRDGFPLEVRVRGNKDADASAGFQPPVQPDRVRLSDGSWADEVPEAGDAGFGGVGPAPSQQQARGVVQRSATPRGYAHPVDVKAEAPPYPRQEDVAKGTVQRSDTATGQAVPVTHEAPGSQSQVKAGTVQRSDTPMGYATPIPSGDAVDAMRVRESSDSKTQVGEPVKVAGNPPGEGFKRGERDEDPAVLARVAVRDGLVAPLVSPGPPSLRSNLDGRDAQGQPAAPDVAFAAGVVPADSPLEPVHTPKEKK